MFGIHMSASGVGSLFNSAFSALLCTCIRTFHMKRKVKAKCLCWSELHSWCSSLASALIALSPLCWSKWVSMGRMKASQSCLLSGGHLKTFHKVHLCPCFLGSIKIACFLPNVSCESRQNWTANSFCSFLHAVWWDKCELYCWSVLSNQVLLILSNVTCGRHLYMERIFLNHSWELVTLTI